MPESPRSTAALTLVASPDLETAPALAEIPVRQLLDRLAFADAHPDDPASKDIFDGFYRRYGPYVKMVAGGALGPNPDEHAVNEILNDTILGFMAKLREFVLPVGASDTEGEKILKHYLATKVHFLAHKKRKFHGSIGKHGLNETEFERAIAAHSVAVSGDPAPITPAREALNADVGTWLQSLPPKHQEIFRRYHSDHRGATASGRVPPGFLEQIARDLGMTTSNVGKIHRRLIQELRAKFGPRLEESHG